MKSDHVKRAEDFVRDVLVRIFGQETSDRDVTTIAERVLDAVPDITSEEVIEMWNRRVIGRHPKEPT